jgi:signal peptidase II
LEDVAGNWYNAFMVDDVQNFNGNDIQDQGNPKANSSERVIPYIILAVIIFLDQATKFLIEDALQPNHSWAPFPSFSSIFRITHVNNTGAAFGLFQSGGNLFMVVAIIVTLVIAIYNHQLPGGNRLFRVALGLQMGGALGNLIDRVRQGHVTDFLDFGPVPVFNVADMSIVSGVIVLALLMLWEDSKNQEESESTSAESSLAQSDHEQQDRTEGSGMLWNE